MFYTECCLLITLIAYIITKIFKPSSEDLCAENISIDSRPNQNFSKTTSTQTDIVNTAGPIVVLNALTSSPQINQINSRKRSVEECLKVLKERSMQVIDDFLDDEIVELVKLKHIPVYKLESYFSNPLRGVSLRYLSSILR